MILTIPQGQHSAGQLACPWALRLPSLKRFVRFDDSCAYTLPDYNQRDVNKLYGISFGFTEDNSVRFGWRWNPEKQGIELVPYVHERGKVVRNAAFDFDVPATIRLGQVAELDILVSPLAYTFAVRHGDFFQQLTIPHGKLNMKYGLTRGVWFGGQMTAPHRMEIELSPQPLL